MTSRALHKGFDHAGYYWEDLEYAFARFSALGFTVARPSFFLEQPFATCAIAIGDAYLSISGVHDWATAPEWMRAGMGTGLQAFVLRGEDLPAVYRKIGPHGNETLQLDGDVETISRIVVVNGEEAIARFRVLRLKRQSLPGLSRCNYCEHLTPELLWRSDLPEHTNGATAISEVVAVHDKPASAAAFYRQLFETVSLTADGDLLVECGTTRLRLLARSRLAEIWPDGNADSAPSDEPGMVGTRIATTDIGMARSVLEQSHIPFAATPLGGISVAASDACGAVIEFVPDRSTSTHQLESRTGQ